MIPALSDHYDFLGWFQFLWKSDHDGLLRRKILGSLLGLEGGEVYKETTLRLFQINYVLLNVKDTREEVIHEFDTFQSTELVYRCETDGVRIYKVDPMDSRWIFFGFNKGVAESPSLLLDLPPKSVILGPDRVRIDRDVLLGVVNEYSRVKLCWFIFGNAYSPLAERFPGEVEWDRVDVLVNNVVAETLSIPEYFSPVGWHSIELAGHWFRVGKNVISFRKASNKNWSSVYLGVVREEIPAKPKSATKGETFAIQILVK